MDKIQLALRGGQVTGYADDENWSISDKTRGGISLISVTILKSFLDVISSLMNIKGAGYLFPKGPGTVFELF